MGSSAPTQPLILHESPYSQAGKVWFWKDLEDGRVAWVLPMMFTARVGVGLGTAHTLDDAWCFETPEKAVQAVIAWDGNGEPEGWHRHPFSGRRRPGGDASQEYVEK